VLGVSAIGAACTSFAAGPTATAPTPGLEDDAGERPDDGQTGDSGAGDRDGGAWIPCANRQTDATHFCADFDDVSRPLEYGWSDQQVDTGGHIEATDGARSAPRAFLSRVDAVATSARAQATLDLLPGAPAANPQKTSLRLTFAVRIDAFPFDGSDLNGFIDLATIRFDDPSCATTSGGARVRGLDVGFSATGELLMFGKGLDDRCPLGPDAWQQAPTRSLAWGEFKNGFRRVVLEIAPETCGGQTGGISARVSVDNEANACHAVGGDPLAHVTSQLRVNVGISDGDAPRAGAVAVYDDVTLDLD
jgi:hypothetical protein